MVSRWTTQAVGVRQAAFFKTATLMHLSQQHGFNHLDKKSSSLEPGLEDALFFLLINEFSCFCFVVTKISTDAVTMVVGSCWTTVHEFSPEKEQMRWEIITV